MIAFILPLIARIGVPERLQRGVAWIALAVLAFALVVAGVLILRAVARSHNETIANTAIEAHDKDLSLEAYNMYVAATEKADANQAARDERAQDNAKELQREVDTKGTDDVAGPAVSGVLDRVRQQQAAGRRR